MLHEPIKKITSFHSRSIKSSAKNWASWIRTSECRSQSPVPYRLAIAQQPILGLGWIQGFEPWASRATIWRANQLRYTHHINMHMKMQACLEGFEPPTHGLEGRCSIQLSYKHIKAVHFCNAKRVMGIEPTYLAWKASVLPLNYTRTIGVTGFEPATSWSQTRRSSQAEPHPASALFVDTYGII